MLPLLVGRVSIHQAPCDSTQQHPRTVQAVRGYFFVIRAWGYGRYSRRASAACCCAAPLALAANRRICKAYIKVCNNNFSLDGLLGYNLYGSAAGMG